MSKYMLVVASSGGHLTQAMAASRRLNNKIVITNKKGVAALNTCDIEVCSHDTTTNILVHFKNLLIAISVFAKYDVTGLLSTGGPMCLPFIFLAKILRKKVFYMDTMSRTTDLSNTGKFVYKFGMYDEFIVQWPLVKEKYEGVICYGPIFNIYNSRDS